MPKVVVIFIFLTLAHLRHLCPLAGYFKYSRHLPLQSYFTLSRYLKNSESDEMIRWVFLPMVIL